MAGDLLKKLLLWFGLAVAIGGTGLAFAVHTVREQRAEQARLASQAKKEDIVITIPEGKRREEIAQLLEEKGICSAADFLTYSQNREGYLFPDTYRFFPDTPAQEVVETLTNTFSVKTRGLNLTSNDVILASIVEREAVTDEERPVIAGIYRNRLDINMKLDADPTVQYAKDSLAFAETENQAPFTFWQPITQADYQGVISPYNTYRSIGLPPGPIANPGLKSLAAALNPTASDYLYFLHKDSQLIPAKTFAEHLNNQN